MPYRNQKLAIDGVYHVFNRSIAKYLIFNDNNEFLRFIQLVQYYKFRQNISLSVCLRKNESLNDERFITEHVANQDMLVEIITYCLMPTHIHLVLKQKEKNGISIFMNNVLNSYTRYFNTKHKRKGPLWESRFKHVAVRTQEQLLYLTCYLHLNPTTAGLVSIPDDWKHSSFDEYINKTQSNKKICNYDDLLDINPEDYKRFVYDNISYQKELAKIKKLLLE
ncbi:MAG: transposase [Endomicrobiales bacterium]|nr:transposase [Endomicrobiales bacterium]